MQEADITIINQAKANARMFETLYKKYADKVYRYLWYRTGRQKDIAEDLTQETFYRALRHLGNFEARGRSYLPYLFTIARNLLINYYRSNRIIPLSELGEFDPPAEVIDSLERQIAVENLKKAVQSLSPTERQAILLRYQEQLPIKDISRILGRSNNAVKLLLSRARKKLAAHPYIKTRDRLARNQPKNPKKSRLLKVKTA